MKEQDKPEARVNLTEVFEKVISEYESGNLESIQISVNCGIRSPKHDDINQDSVPINIVKDLLMKVLNSHTKEKEAYSFFGSNLGVPADEYGEITEELIEELRTWQKGRGDE